MLTARALANLLREAEGVWISGTRISSQAIMLWAILESRISVNHETM
jgi:hypothetical protein